MIDKSKAVRPAVIDMADAINDLETLSVLEYTDFTYPNSDFTYYATSGNDAPGLVKYGKIAMLSGGIKCVNAQNSLGNKHIMTIPEGYRPRKQMIVVSNGSSSNKFRLTVDPNGNVYAGTYGTNNQINIPANAWLALNCVYITT